MHKKNIFFYFGSHAHPYYEKIIKNMPKGMTCTSSVQDFRGKHVAFDRYGKIKSLLKRFIRFLFQKIGVPKVAFVKVVDDVDIILYFIDIAPDSEGYKLVFPDQSQVGFGILL